MLYIDIWIKKILWNREDSQRARSGKYERLCKKERQYRMFGLKKIDEEVIKDTVRDQKQAKAMGDKRSRATRQAVKTSPPKPSPPKAQPKTQPEAQPQPVVDRAADQHRDAGHELVQVERPRPVVVQRVEELLHCLDWVRPLSHAPPHPAELQRRRRLLEEHHEPTI